MNITLEISMYPLRSDYELQVLKFLDILSAHKGLDIRVNALSTQVQGEFNEAMNALRDAIAQTYGEGIRASFVIKTLPGDVNLNYTHKA
jgi:uncharacterized protein YqgV (UPF0045/DUF77 family)